MNKAKDAANSCLKSCKRGPAKLHRWELGKTFLVSVRRLRRLGAQEPLLRGDHLGVLCSLAQKPQSTSLDVGVEMLAHGLTLHWAYLRIYARSPLFSLKLALVSEMLHTATAQVVDATMDLQIATLYLCSPSLVLRAQGLGPRSVTTPAFWRMGSLCLAGACCLENLAVLVSSMSSSTHGEGNSSDLTKLLNHEVHGAEDVQLHRVVGNVFFCGLQSRTTI